MNVDTSAHVTEAYDWNERTLIGSRGEYIGVVQAVYVDSVTQRLDWALVRTGRFLRKATFVPLSGARTAGEDIWVRHTREQVRDAPSLEPGEPLSAEIEAEVFAHYAVAYKPPPDDATQTRLRRHVAHQLPDIPHDMEAQAG